MEDLKKKGKKGRRPKFFVWKNNNDDLKMEDDLKKMKMEDDLKNIFFLNGRRTNQPKST